MNQSTPTPKRQIYIKEILENKYVPHPGDFIQVQVLFNSGIYEQGERSICDFILADKENHICAVIFVQPDDYKARNVCKKLKLDSKHRITRFATQRSSNTLNYDLRKYIPLREQDTCVRLQSSTACIFGVPLDVEVVPTNFLDYLPFEFTNLDKIDHTVENFIDVIGFTEDVSDIKKSSNECEFRTIQLGTSRKTEESYSIRISLFGRHVQLIKNKRKTNPQIFALLNVKVCNFNHEKSICATNKTVIVEINRDNLNKLPPGYREASLVSSLFPKKRQSVRRNNRDRISEGLTSDGTLTNQRERVHESLSLDIILPPLTPQRSPSKFITQDTSYSSPPKRFRSCSSTLTEQTTEIASGRGTALEFAEEGQIQDINMVEIEDASASNLNITPENLDIERENNLDVELSQSTRELTINDNTLLGTFNRYTADLSPHSPYIPESTSANNHAAYGGETMDYCYQDAEQSQSSNGESSEDKDGNESVIEVTPVYACVHPTTSNKENANWNSWRGNQINASDKYDFQNGTKPLKVKVTAATEWMDSGSNTYRMRSKLRGVALIIHNYCFTDSDDPDRKGGVHDTVYLNNILRSCNFDVTIKFEVKFGDYQELIEGFKNGVRDNYQTIPDSLFVAILSHGSQNEVKMVDGRCIKTSEELIDQFDEDHFIEMVGKPKIFVIGTCQGRESSPETLNRPSIFPQPERRERGRQNMIVCYAASPGTTSLRDKWLGSHYIYTLSDVMMEHAHNTDFVTMLDEVQRKIASIKQDENVKNKTLKAVQQDPVWNQYQFKMLYFNPGL